MCIILHEVIYIQTYMINKGVKNELNFVDELDGKRVSEVKYNIRLFLADIFQNINEYSIIKCYKNIDPQKYDIIIEIENIIKRISIKMGVKNSVHSEPISEFVHFLMSCQMPKRLIFEFLKYHYADGTTNGSGKIRMTSEEYKIKKQKKIDKINLFLNKKDILLTAIDRFVLKGRNSDYYVDAIISGTPDDFLWLKRKDVYKILIKHKDDYSTGIHFSNLFYQPMSRCINRNPKYEDKRYVSQIKWYNLFDNILESMNDNIDATNKDN